MTARGDEPDEFTIPRPRWIVPLAVIGVLFLVGGLVWAAFFSAAADPEVRFTGGTTTVVTTTTR